MKRILFSLLTLGLSLLCFSCSTTETIQVNALVLDPPLQIDTDRELTEEELNGVREAVTLHLYPDVPSFPEISPLHANEGGGVLAFWLAARTDSQSKKGHSLIQGALILDNQDGTWLVR